MSVETLEFVIYPDGRVVETVRGIQGRDCQAVTAAIEAKLGKVTQQEPTDEFYQQAQNQQLKQTEGQTQSDPWG